MLPLKNDSGFLFDYRMMQYTAIGGGLTLDELKVEIMTKSVCIPIQAEKVEQSQK